MDAMKVRNAVDGRAWPRRRGTSRIGPKAAPTGRSETRLLCAFALLLGLLSFPGCAAVALTAGSIVGGAGVDHTLSGITYKTFAASLAEMRLATLMTLERMDMTVTKDQESETGREIEATARDRTIDIELEAISQKTTRMRVVANQGEIFFKDSATATEIILQTAETLEREIARAE